MFDDFKYGEIAYWDTTLLNIAHSVALNSPHPTRKVGACAKTTNNKIIVGWNKTPDGVYIDWSSPENRHGKAMHAERTCLRYCTPNEVDTIAITVAPCDKCIVDIASYNIKRVIYDEIYDYKGVDLAFKLAEDFGITMVQICQIKK